MATPKEFGRGTWVYLFYINMLDFDDIEFNKYLTNQIIRSLPCEKCKIKATKYLSDVNFDSISNRLDIIKILMDLRNEYYPKINLDKFDNNFLFDEKLKNKIIYLISDGLGN